MSFDGEFTLTRRGCIVSLEVRAVSSLALLYVIRMLGLFMVLPVLMLSGASYTGSSPASLGFALGIYGLTQAIFQIPLGFLSDLWGRKQVIALGLFIFAVGSALAAYSDSITGLIIGRALQGSGAVASAIMALVADLTSDESRTKAMAAIGASIGISFALAIILGPILAGIGGIELIFAVTTVLALLGILILWLVVPNPTKATVAAQQRKVVPNMMLPLLKDVRLLRLNFGIFCLHCILMGVFVSIPYMISHILKLETGHHWWVYLGVLLGSFVVMIPLMIVAERKKKAAVLFLGSIVAMATSLLLLYTGSANALLFIFSLFVFFVAFNYLEASLPALISRAAPAETKGTALGIFSTSQFLGAFVGGSMGGWLFQHHGSSAVFLTATALVSVWLAVTWFGRDIAAIKI